MKRSVVAVIDEARCIGCARCIDACPVDAIAGAEQFLHTVIAAYCVGCRLCLPPCPVDCIGLSDAARLPAWTRADADAAQQRHRRRKARLARADHALHETDRSDDATARRAIIARVLARAAQKNDRR